jgi:hypothetical protein
MNFTWNSSINQREKCDPSHSATSRPSGHKLGHNGTRFVQRTSRELLVSRAVLICLTQSRPTVPYCNLHGSGKFDESLISNLRVAGRDDTVHHKSHNNMDGNLFLQQDGEGD